MQASAEFQPSGLRNDKGLKVSRKHVKVKRYREIQVTEIGRG